MDLYVLSYDGSACATQGYVGSISFWYFMHSGGRRSMSSLCVKREDGSQAWATEAGYETGPQCKYTN
eukprot:2975483-Prymnesium_polylepis.1